MRIYLPPDVNCLLSIANQCFKSTNQINVIVSDKQPHLQYLTIDAAIAHCTDRFSIAIDVIDRVPKLQVAGAHTKEQLKNRHIECRQYAYTHGTDLPEVVNWRWKNPDS